MKKTMPIIFLICILTASCSSLQDVGKSVDRVAPRLTISKLSGQTNAQNFSVSVDAIDNLTGVKAIFYRVDAGDIRYFFSNGIIRVSNACDGAHSIEVWSLDRNFNSSVTQTVRTTVDTTPPALEFVSPAEGQILSGSVIPLSVNATDSILSVRDVFVSVNSSVWIRLNGSASLFSSNLALAADTVSEIRIYGVDTLGNTSATNSITISWSFNAVSNSVYVRGGSFTMGTDLDWLRNLPERTVTVSDFYIDKFETTFDEWDAYHAAVTNAPNPDDQGWGRGQWPVIMINWKDAIAYCNWRSAQEGYPPAYNINTGGLIIIGGGVTNPAASVTDVKGYRLPTEAEWEFAARSRGTKSPDQFTASAGWCAINSSNTAHPVGQKAPNELGICDMSGNAAEWCQDWYAAYNSAETNNPAGPLTGSEKVFRGGGALLNPDLAWSGTRLYLNPDARTVHIGLRLVRSR